MSTLAGTFKATRSKMAEMDSDALSHEFSLRFSLSEGAYLELRRSGEGWRPCRILAVRDVYQNRWGGYTADVLVAKLLRNGSTGVGRSLTLVTDFAGNGLRISATNMHVRRTTL